MNPKNSQQARQVLRRLKEANQIRNNPTARQIAYEKALADAARIFGPKPFLGIKNITRRVEIAKRLLSRTVDARRVPTPDKRQDSRAQTTQPETGRIADTTTVPEERQEVPEIEETAFASVPIEDTQSLDNTETAETTAHPTSEDFLSPAGGVVYSQNKPSSETKKDTKSEPSSTGVVSTFGIGLPTPFQHPQITAEMQKPKVRIGEVFREASRVGDSTLAQIRKGDLGLEWKQALEEFPEEVDALVRRNILDRAIGNYVRTHGVEADRFADHPEIAEGLRKKKLVDGLLRDRKRLEPRWLQNKKFKELYESQTSGLIAGIYDARTVVDSPMTDEQLMDVSLTSQASLLHRFGQFEPETASELGITETLQEQNISMPPLPNPTIPPVGDVLNLKGRVMEKAGGMLAKTEAGKAVTGFLGKKAAEAGLEKVAAGAVSGTAVSAGLTAALTPFLGPLAAVAARALTWLGSKLLIPLYKGIRKYAKGLAQIGTGLLLLGGLMGSALVGGIGVGFVGLSLAGGGVGLMLGGIGTSLGAIGSFLLTHFILVFLLPLFISIGIVAALIGIILFITNTSGYLTPKSDPLAPPNAAISEFFDVVKIANPPGPISNTQVQNGIDVTYSIAIQAGDEELSNITFLDTYNITQIPATAKAPDPAIPDDAQPSNTPPTTIAANSLYTLTYTVHFDRTFQNSSVCNNFTVGAVADGVPSSETATVCVTIGTPPTQCPSGWPVTPASGRTYKLTQGFNTFYTEGSHGQRGPEEAVDIALGRAPRSDDYVYATHDGTVQKINASSDYGNRVQIEGVCNGKSFVSYYGHLRNDSFAEGLSVGQKISRGDRVGLVGDTGVAGIGYHVHYSFYPYGGPVFMGIPYLPVDREQIRGCNDFATRSLPCGNIVIQ